MIREFFKKKKSLTFLKDFAEGKVSTEVFWEKYKQDTTLQKILINDKKRPKGVYRFNHLSHQLEYDKKAYLDSLYLINPESLLTIVDITKLEHRYELFAVVKRYFMNRKVKLKFYNKDEEYYIYLQKLLPEWLNVDCDFLEKIINSVPLNLSKDEKLLWGKNRIKELFKFEKTPPKWVQEPEWPIINEKPLIFKYQKENKLGAIEYYFYNPDTMKDIIIEQAY